MPVATVSQPDQPREREPPDVSTAERPHSVSVAGVIVGGRGRALLVKRRDNGHWEPPGGVVEAGETLSRRPPARGLRGDRRQDRPPSRPDRRLQGMEGLIVSLVFRCGVIDGQPTTGEETMALRWITREEVSELADEAYAIRVLDALDAASPPAICAHDGTKLV